MRATTKNAYQAQKVAFCSLLPSVVPAAGLLGKRTGKLSVKHMPAVVPWEINPQISDEFAPICPQLSRSIDAVWPLRHGICKTPGFAKRNASKFATIRGHTRPGTGAALSLL
ncbi:MAG: hypothetical protein E6G80_20690 [Alphaproteobacteria bacterium]|nr:MAG: hypothetical protein E6G80_20690 [Alphaproteobacteria bacterium]